MNNPVTCFFCGKTENDSQVAAEKGWESSVMNHSDKPIGPVCDSCVDKKVTNLDTTPRLKGK